MKKILAIGGSDPSGWAGIQSDILTFSFFKTRGFSAITAITAQTESGVTKVTPLSQNLVKKQAEEILKYHRMDAIKIGMLGTKKNADSVRDIIKKWKLKNIVLDPIARSTSGYPLLDEKGTAALKRLLPFVTIVTPNLDEAEALSGIKIKNTADIKKAAERILSFGVPYVLIKGGHLKGAPIDALFNGKRFYSFKGSRIRAVREKFHGTGCLLSSAIAAGLANGKSMNNAIKEAKRYVRKVVRGR